MRGADSVILGCTELGLSVDATCLPLPCFDSTHIHAQAAVDFALGGMTVSRGIHFAMDGAYI
jgi:aspartate racemase